jgi:peptidoglycan/xylan/chitin deacetylase (PgdA/CDA1 family)
LYHAVGRQGEQPSRYIVPAKDFERQMAWLEWRGANVITLEEFLSCLREYRLPPAHSVVITMDDGYADNYEVAYPILRRYRFPATIFLVSDELGGCNDWDHDSELGGRRLLPRSDIWQMHAGGMQFGAHTRTHPKLDAVPNEQVYDEVYGSRETLERALHVPIRTFAYPYGRYDARTARIVEQAGFWCGCTVRFGANTSLTHPYGLHRFEVRGTDSFLDFVIKLEWSLSESKRDR